MYIDIEDKQYEVIIVRKNNKNTYIRVKDDCKIYVYTSKQIKEKEINKILLEHYNSIFKMIKKVESKNKNKNKTYYLGNEIDIIVFPDQTKPELYNNKFYIKDRTKLDYYYKVLAMEVFKERLEYIYNIIEEPIPYPKLKIRKMTSRWGICNRKNISVTLNLELIKKDIKYIDYVIIHELVHFIEFNHSQNFWKYVEKYCSDYKKIRKEMKE